MNKLCPIENTIFKSARFVQKYVLSSTYNLRLLQEVGSGKQVRSVRFLAAYRYFLSLPSIAAGWKMLKIFPSDHKEEAEHS